jgi:hypothetical protein
VELANWVIWSFLFLLFVVAISRIILGRSDGNPRVQRKGFLKFLPSFWKKMNPGDNPVAGMADDYGHGAVYYHPSGQYRVDMNINGKTMPMTFPNGEAAVAAIAQHVNTTAKVAQLEAEVEHINQNAAAENPATVRPHEPMVKVEERQVAVNTLHSSNAGTNEQAERDLP